ncbi:hypothetical protein MCBG_01969 [Micromonospora sp. M42]|nr:hypothetical protein MCBG_01969 [Micromonospora sp. M42]
MARILLALRQRILTPDKREALFDTRGFHVKNDAARQALESAGQSFIGGFGDAAGAPEPRAAEELLESRPAPLRGFAYEGAAMAYALMDGLRPGGGRGMARFLAGRGDAHVYMAHVGAGWAMARLPRWRRPAILPPDPLLRWLALDGYGFHQALLNDGQYVNARHATRRTSGRRSCGTTRRTRWTRASAGRCGSSPAPTRPNWSGCSTGSPPTGTPTCGAGSAWPPATPVAPI